MAVKPLQGKEQSDQNSSAGGFEHFQHGWLEMDTFPFPPALSLIKNRFAHENRLVASE
jgi:hypothetical protein